MNLSQYRMLSWRSIFYREEGDQSVPSAVMWLCLCGSRDHFLLTSNPESDNGLMQGICEVSTPLVFWSLISLIFPCCCLFSIISGVSQFLSEISCMTLGLRPSSYPPYLSFTQCLKTNMDSYQLVLSAFISVSEIIKDADFLLFKHLYILAAMTCSS